MCVMFLTYTMQIAEGQDSNELLAVFVMDEAAELLLSTGFRKALCSFNYHCLVKVKAARAKCRPGKKHFCAGLRVYPRD